MECPFCSLEVTRKWTENEQAIAVPDAHSVTDGPKLVVPRKHVSSIYELTADSMPLVLASPSAPWLGLVRSPFSASIVSIKRDRGHDLCAHSKSETGARARLLDKNSVSWF